MCVRVYAHEGTLMRLENIRLTITKWESCSTEGERELEREK